MSRLFARPARLRRAAAGGPGPRPASGRRARTVAAPAALVTFALLVGTACGADGRGTSGAADGDPVQGGELTYALAPVTDCVDARQRPQLESRTAGRQLADTLTEQDPDSGEILPWLATSWEINDEVTEFIFTLREDVTFSDGEAFDADAVVANLDAIEELGARAPQASSFLIGYEQAVAEDPFTVRVTFDRPNAQFLQATATQSLVQLSPASLDADPADLCAGDFAGSGPFTLESFTPERRVELTARDDYAWPSPLAENDGAPYLDSVVLESIPENSVRQGSLTSGQVDLIESVPSTGLDTLEATDGMTVVESVLPAIAIPYVPHVNSPQLDDPRTRRALGLALDREAIVEAVYQGAHAPSTGVLTPTNPGYTDQSAEVRHDQEAAAQLLDEAGWDTVGEDGVRERDGERLSLTIVYEESASEAEQQHQLVQQQWAEVGVELVLEPRATLPDVTRDEALGDVSTWSQTRGDVDVLRLVYSSFHPEMSMLYNNADEELDDLLDQLQTTVDTEERNDLAARAQERIIEQGYAVPVYDRTRSYGHSDAVGGLTLDLEGKVLLNDLWRVA